LFIIKYHAAISLLAIPQRLHFLAFRKEKIFNQIL